MTDAPRSRTAALPVPVPWLAFGLAIGLVLATLWLFSRSPEPLPTVAEQLAELGDRFPQDTDLLVHAAAPPDGWTEGRVLHVDEDGRLVRVEVSYTTTTDDPDGAGLTRVEVDVCSARDPESCRTGEDLVLTSPADLPATQVLLRDPAFEQEVAGPWTTVELVQG